MGVRAKVGLGLDLDWFWGWGCGRIKAEWLRQMTESKTEKHGPSGPVQVRNAERCGGRKTRDARMLCVSTVKPPNRTAIVMHTRRSHRTEEAKRRSPQSHAMLLVACSITEHHIPYLSMASMQSIKWAGRVFTTLLTYAIPRHTLLRSGTKDGLRCTRLQRRAERPTAAANCCKPATAARTCSAPAYSGQVLPLR